MNKGNTKESKIKDDDNIEQLKIRRNDASNLPREPLQLNDVQVKCRYKIGDEVEEDASCDSEYMLSAMNCVGAAIYESYH